MGRMTMTPRDYQPRDLRFILEPGEDEPRANLTCRVRVSEEELELLRDAASHRGVTVKALLTIALERGLRMEAADMTAWVRLKGDDDE